MIKRLVALGGATALLLGAAVPAFAWGSWGSRDVAIVQNSATAEANTGLNIQGNAAYIGGADDVDDTTVSGNNTMYTGDASATAKATVIANTHVGCGCESRGHKDIALVGNSAYAGANTGLNWQGNVAVIGGDSDDGSLSGDHHGRGADVDDTNVSGDNYMDTGDASATSKAFVLVNTHLNWGD